MVESLKIITERGVAPGSPAFAFDVRARVTAGSKVTAIHKANIMKLSDGLFLDVRRRDGTPSTRRSRTRSGSSTPRACSW